MVPSCYFVSFVVNAFDLFDFPRVRR